jgi:hypothetical protein
MLEGIWLAPLQGGNCNAVLGLVASAAGLRAVFLVSALVVLSAATVAARLLMVRRGA